MSKFDINSLKPITRKKNMKLFKNNSVEFFSNHEKVLEALALILAKGDRKSFYDVLSMYLHIINKEELSRKSKVPIATIRRMAAGANFNIDNFLKITAAINKDLAS